MLPVPCARLCATTLFAVGLAAEASAQHRPLEASLNAAFAARELKGLHGVMVYHRGDLLAEVYFPGRDQRWGVPLGRQEHGPETLHDVRSISKSVTALLYGIALERALVPPPDTPLYLQFPEYPDLVADPARKGITIRHALSMTMGLSWREDLPYTSPKNSEIAMENAPDRIRFVLERPVVTPPGTTFTYSGGATALLAALIERGTGMPLDTFAEQALFAPLGIDHFEWIRGRDGVPAAASGLRLTLPGLARIGLTVADQGVWAGQQVVPHGWIDQVMTPEATHPGGLRYGLQWWLSPETFPGFWAAAMGNGGQRLTVQPSLGLVVAVMAGNYNSPTDWHLPARVIEGHVVPVLRQRLGR